MIRITIYKDMDNDYVGFQAKDHAMYAEAGQDIVCAGASILLINTINSIEKFTDDPFSQIAEEENVMINLELLDKPSKETTLLLDAMVLGLESIAEDEDFAEYIQLTFEEV